MANSVSGAAKSLSELLYRKRMQQQNKEMFNTELYDFQKEILSKLEDEANVRKMFAVCLPRRAGKDILAFYTACKIALSKPNMNIGYLFPTKQLGRDVLFNGVTFENLPFISSVINPYYLKKPKSGALYFFDNTIRFINGSRIFLMGAD